MPPKTKKAVPTILEIENYAHLALKKWLRALQKQASLKKRVLEQSGTNSIKNFIVEMTVCNANRMSRLNLQYRGKTGPTDVLSFAADSFFQHQGILGDLVICAPVLLKQAKDYDHSWKKEMDVLIVHGLLHLLHFDHELGEKEAREMAKWERKLLGLSSKTSLITRASLQ
jgi:probable rRNA maturation factor